MSSHTFMLFLTGSAAILALWLVARFPKLSPQSGRGVSMWLGGAILCFVAVPQTVMLVGGMFGALVAAMLVALPGGICIFLAIAWIMLYVLRSIQPFMR
jgi:uncharacterized membrane protein